MPAVHRHEPDGACLWSMTTIQSGAAWQHTKGVTPCLQRQPLAGCDTLPRVTALRRSCPNNACRLRVEQRP
jgi:hypothetical protein